MLEAWLSLNWNDEMNKIAKPIRRSGRSLLPALLVGGMGCSALESASAEDIMCQSRSGQHITCDADASDGVILLTQLSDAGCYEGSTWGYNRREIWVANGCRAVFRTGAQEHSAVKEHGRVESGASGSAGAIAGLALALGAAAAIHNAREDDDDDDDDYRYHDYSRYRGRTAQVTCESINDGYNECRADVGRRGSVHMVQRLSRSGCRFNDDWGFDRRGIWVDNGCRARFEVED